MRIAVCLKQVPDVEARLSVDAAGTWIREGDVPFVINESDEYALEEAQRLAEGNGGEVVVFSVGPDRVREALRKALALGAQRAVHIEDQAGAGGDAAATARTLAAAIARDPFDLVLTGSLSDDLRFGSTGSMLAGELGWPHAWLVMGVEIENGGGSAVISREMEGGMNEVCRLRLPAVLEVQAGINTPRYASLKGIMQAKRKPLDSVTIADLGLEASQVGIAGSRVEVVSIGFPEVGDGAQMLEGEPQEVAAVLIEKLQREARVL